LTTLLILHILPQSYPSGPVSVSCRRNLDLPYFFFPSGPCLFAFHATLYAHTISLSNQLTRFDLSHPVICPYPASPLCILCVVPRRHTTIWRSITSRSYFFARSPSLPICRLSCRLYLNSFHNISYVTLATASLWLVQKWGQGFMARISSSDRDLIKVAGSPQSGIMGSTTSPLGVPTAAMSSCVVDGTSRLIVAKSLHRTRLYLGESTLLVNGRSHSPECLSASPNRS